MSYNFKRITCVPTASDLKDIVLSKTQRKTPTVVHKAYSIGRIRAFYTRKVKFLQQTLHDKLTEILTQFPNVEEVHPFYADLMNILYDKDHYKIALGQMNTARHLIDGIAREYVRMMKYADSLYRCKMLKRAALGRMVKLLIRNKSSFEYLEQVRQHLSRLPSIDPNTRTLILCGFPNVGKSSFINKMTRADVEVQPYAFTTKSLYVGHLDYKYLRWQVIDTPGILDQPLECRNTIEMQAVTALAHLKAAIIFMMDISEQCDHTIEEQIHLFESIRPLFANKPVVLGLNKIDIVRRNDLPLEKQKLLEQVESSGIPILPLSTISEEGVSELRNNACESLLSQRVEEKLHNKKINDSGVLSRVFVAYPESRDEKVRLPFVPEGAKQKMLQKKVQSMETDAPENDLTPYRDENTRRLEREIEIEMGNKYILDLKKRYLLKNENEKYDIIPEIWEGHNIADFIHSNYDNLYEKIKTDETSREAAGVYDEDMETDDEETTKFLEISKQITEKEQLIRLDSRLRDRINVAKQSRLIARKSERTKEKLQQQLGSLGINVSEDRLKNMHAESEKQLRGKKMNIGFVPTIKAPAKIPKRLLSMPSTTARAKASRLHKFANRLTRTEGKKGEADRHVYTKMPKHLFSGKRGIGKTDRR
uniref:Nucleolar GTP-binding protein 1 n=1 Tax=Parastrongyloides trichosuri TaxID=131310 RepID=A0A0N4ZT74_PARTI